LELKSFSVLDALCFGGGAGVAVHMRKAAATWPVREGDGAGGALVGVVGTYAGVGMGCRICGLGPGVHGVDMEEDVYN
jgi:hypothetical protein